MEEQKKETEKGFWTKFLEKMDKKMKECAQAKSCCGGQNKSDNKTCCSK